MKDCTEKIGSISDWYRQGPYSRFPTEFRSGGSLAIEFLRADQQAHDFTDPAIPQVVLQIGLRVDTSFSWNIGDGWTPLRKLRSGEMILAPAETQAEFDVQGPHDILIIGIPADHLSALLDRDGRRADEPFAPLHGPAFRDETVRRHALQMWTEAAKGDRASNLMVDGLLQTIVGQLLRRSDRREAPRGRTLAPEILATIDEYIETQSYSGLTIAELASLSGISQFQFARDFKETTGVTPHAYVLERRILKAREMLAAGRLPIAEIAYACGFSSQSHMTDVFRERVGTTPGRYRADRRD